MCTRATHALWPINAWETNRQLRISLSKVLLKSFEGIHGTVDIELLSLYWLGFSQPTTRQLLHKSRPQIIANIPIVTSAGPPVATHVSCYFQWFASVGLAIYCCAYVLWLTFQVHTYLFMSVSGLCRMCAQILLSYAMSSYVVVCLHFARIIIFGEAASIVSSFVTVSGKWFQRGWAWNTWWKLVHWNYDDKHSNNEGY